MNIFLKYENLLNIKNFSEKTMKKYIIFFGIVSLIITTSIVKSSTRQLEKNCYTYMR